MRSLRRLSTFAAMIALTAPPMAVAAPSHARASAAPLYKDASQPIEARVDDLLQRMTLEEKVAQMTSRVGRQEGDLRRASASSIPPRLRTLYPNGMGQFARPSDAEGAVVAARRARPRRPRRRSRSSTRSSIGRSTRPGSASRSCSTRKGCTATRRWAPPASRRRSPLASHLGSRSGPPDRHGRRRARSARAASASRSRRWSTSPAIRAGAASRKPSARIPIWSARWASPRSRASRATRMPLAARQGLRHAQAPDRPRPARKRHQCRPGRHLRAHAAREFLPAVRAGGEAHRHRAR